MELISTNSFNIKSSDPTLMEFSVYKDEMLEKIRNIESEMVKLIFQYDENKQCYSLVDIKSTENKSDDADKSESTPKKRKMDELNTNVKKQKKNE